MQTVLYALPLLGLLGLTVTPADWHSWGYVKQAKAGTQVYTQKFSETIEVTGTPLLKLETGSVDRSAEFSYSSGSTAYFVYTVICGDSTNDLNIFDVSSLTLNGGTITDIGGNNATLTLPSSTALSANAAVVVSTTGCAAGPTVSSVSSTTTDGTKKVGDISLTLKNSCFGYFIKKSLFVSLNTCKSGLRSSLQICNSSRGNQRLCLSIKQSSACACCRSACLRSGNV